MNNYETARQVIADITLMNNRFMNKVFDGNIPAAQRVLRIILNNDKIKVVNVSIQRLIQNLYGHSAQLDILAEDELGRKFNVEVQRSNNGSSPKRARFYSSALDMNFLEANTKYELLPDSYVIFITENDVLANNRPVYNICRYIYEDGKPFGDGSHIVYVNASCKDDTPLGRLMQDFSCTDPAKMHYPELAEKVTYFKTTKEGEFDMTDIIELYAENKAKKAAKEAAHQKQIDFATKLLRRGDSVETIADLTDLPVEEVRILAGKMSA